MKLKKILSFLLVVIALTSCEDFVTGIDEKDPTRATDADLKLFFSGTQLEYAGTLEGAMARQVGMWTGYFTGSDRQYTTLHSYVTTAGDYDSPWGNIYAFTLKTSRIAQGKATELNNRVSLGVMQVIEAHIMGTAAALWGDVPYREAANQAQFPNPAYDPQVQVIDDVLALLDVAIGHLTSGTGTNTGDILYPVNATGVAKWVRAANTLKARYLLYKKDYAGALAAANAGILVNADNLVLTHGTSNNQNRNIYYDFMERQRVGYMTAAPNVFLKTLMTGRSNAKTNETARRAVYYNPSGAPNTLVGGFFGSATSFPLLTAVENLLIKAECEAMLSGTITAGVTALNQARAQLRAAYPTGTYTDFVDADFAAAGIENPGVTDKDALIREIHEEKYVSLYGQIEIFNEIRRTGNSVGVPPNSGTQIPQRFLVPQNEINANTSHPDPIPDLYAKTPLFQ